MADAKSNITPLTVQQVPLRNVISSAQEFADHMTLLLDALKTMIPDPENSGLTAHSFVQMILNHTEYHGDMLIREMRAIDGIGERKAA